MKDYRAKDGDLHKTMALPIAEFIRRFLTHVLPSGFHRIRHYGLFANGGRAENLARARHLLAMPAFDGAAGDSQTVDPEEPPSSETLVLLGLLQGLAPGLVDPPLDQPRGTGDAGAVTATGGQRLARALEAPQDRPVLADPDAPIAAVDPCDPVQAGHRATGAASRPIQIQMSEVQSPPG